ncbi:MAG: hypothetical protein IIC71_12835 [Acidobacteria bacterium]|nr:hypothetical protein [Acidobacteriota bacterium]
MEIAQHIAVVGQEAKLFAQAAEHGGLDADISTCPEMKPSASFALSPRRLVCRVSLE